MPKHLITFVNDTSLPINIATWNSEKYFSEYITILVPSNTAIENISSDTGEYFLDTYIYNKEMCDKWKAAGYQPDDTIGKFRDHPDYRGEYAWNVHDDFKIIYDKEKRTSTFSKK